MTDLDEVLTAETVSKWTGVPVTTLKSWRLQGRGPKAFQLGQRRHTRYLRSDVIAWIQAQHDRTGGSDAA